MPDIHNGRFRRIRRGKNGQKDDGLAERIVGSVDFAHGDENHLPGLQHTLIATAPLLCLTADDIDDLFARRVVMKRMALPVLSPACLPEHTY